MSTTRQYELVYIVTPEASEQDVADLHTQVEQIIERLKGTLDKTENWGRRKLAYEIDHRTDGHYAVMRFTTGERTLVELKRILRVSDDILRHIVVKLPPSYAHEPLPEPAEISS